MNMVWHKWISALKEIVENDHQESADRVPPLSEIIEQARLEWLDAQRYYNTVSDEDLVDHAVYMMQAAEKKYIYLLKQAREKGITNGPFPD